jgi:TPP-dependent indolepyruvate ferredoxin oxidoreductase alpha subunit
LKNTWTDLLPDKPAKRPNLSYVPKRPPQMCPGCGHRSAFHAIKKALQGTEITVADIGCHTLKKPNYALKQVAIDQETCQRLHECIAQFACPTFTRQPDGRIEVNPDLCIGDGSCVQTCPVNAIQAPKL